MILVRPRTVLLVLIAASVGLIAMYFGTQVFRYQFSVLKLEFMIKLLDADGEQTIPAWYSSGLLLVSAALLAVIAVAQRQQRAAGAWYWAGLALIFLFLSIDESASIHELLTPLRDNFQLRGIFYFAWVVPAMGALLVFGAVYFRFWLRLPARTRWLLALSAAIYLGGALAMEMVGASIFEVTRGRVWFYRFVMAAEELFEMLGLALLIFTLLTHLRDHLPEARIVFAPPADPQAERLPGRALGEPAQVGGRAMAD